MRLFNKIVPFYLQFAFFFIHSGLNANEISKFLNCVKSTPKVVFFYFKNHAHKTHYETENEIMLKLIRILIKR